MFYYHSQAILIFFQIVISIGKLMMFTFKQQQIFKIVQNVQNAEILNDFEIFELSKLLEV